MSQRKSSPLAVALLALVTVLCLFGIFRYRDQFLYVDDIRYEKTVTRLDLSGAPIRDLDRLAQLQALQHLNVRGTGLSIAEYEQLHRALPECTILWDVPFQGKFYPHDRKTMTVSSLTDEDVAVLDHFPQLTTVYAEQCRDYAQLQALRLRRPEVHVAYTVEVAGQEYSYNTRAITAPGDDLEALEAMFPFLPGLESVTLTAPLADMDRILALREAYPEIGFTWTLEFKGIRLDEFTETLDLTGIPTTVEEMDALLPYLPNLTYVDMTDCGIDNEAMEDLNNRHENVKIVWTVTLGRWFRIRTDATWFMPVKYDFYPNTSDLYNLRYCHDIIALDIGHMNVRNCDFVAYMPHLKYLLLADTKVSDLTPLTGLTELVYLELFLTHVTDYSPLLTLTSLEDLNLHYTRGDPEIIAQMTWLKNLWWGHNDTWRIGWNTQQMLRAALPDCHCEFQTASSTGAGWRQLPNYFAQRDIFGMRYMK